LVFMNGIASAQTTDSKSLSLPTEKIDALVQGGIDKKQFPGATLIIGKNDKILYQKAYGRYTFEPDAKPMTMDTLFDMASISKVVGTASTAMGLVEDGKLDINKPVADYINGFGKNGKDKVRPRDLM